MIAEAGVTRRAVGFDAHDVAVDAEHRGGKGEGQHARTLCVALQTIV